MVKSPIVLAPLVAQVLWHTLSLCQAQGRLSRWVAWRFVEHGGLFVFVYSFRYLSIYFSLSLCIYLFIYIYMCVCVEFWIMFLSIYLFMWFMWFVCVRESMMLSSLPLCCSSCSKGNHDETGGWGACIFQRFALKILGGFLQGPFHHLCLKHDQLWCFGVLHFSQPLENHPWMACLFSCLYVFAFFNHPNILCCGKTNCGRFVAGPHPMKWLWPYRDWSWDAFGGFCYPKFSQRPQSRRLWEELSPSGYRIKVSTVFKDWQDQGIISDFATTK